MSLAPLFSFIWLWAYELSWSQCLWGRHRFVCLKILVLRQGCSSKGQIWALSLCMMTAAYGSLHFSAIFSGQSFVDSVAFWCHSSTRCEDKGIKWRLLNQMSLFGCTYPFLFHVVFTGIFHCYVKTMLMRQDVYWYSASTTISDGHCHTKALKDWGKK